MGNAVTEFSKLVEGTTGYVIKVNTAALLFEKVNSVQAQAESADTPEPVTAETTLNIIQGYLNDTGCPDLAFNHDRSTITIFFKTSAFPYISTTRFALFGLRKAQATTAGTDYIDCPEKDIELAQHYALDIAYKLKKTIAPDTILDRISELEQGINDE